MHHWHENDKVWVYLVCGVILLMVVFGAIRAVKSKAEAKPGFGAQVVDLGELSGPILVKFDTAPALRVKGGAIVVKTGDRQLFVIRVDDEKYRAYDTRTLDRKPLKWQPDKEALVIAGRVTIGFDVETGNPIQPGVTDSLRPYIVRITPDGVEITPP